MTYLDKNFGQIFKPNAFESFKKECQDKCRINVFDIFLETTLENHSKTSRI